MNTLRTPRPTLPPLWSWIVLILLTPARLVLPAYSGPGQAMFEAIGWTLFSSLWWFFLCASVMPRRAPLIYLGGAVGVSILLESLQGLSALSSLRATTIGLFFLGSDPSMWDVLIAVLGADAGLILYLGLASQANRHRSSSTPQ